jgi:hypothetical protein
LLIGFILSQVGLYFTNRWGRSPRPDEELSKALKGLNQEYTLYHYATPAKHLLLGPAGIWALSVHQQNGEITYQNGKWKHTGTGRGFFLRRWFGQEGLGRPDLEIGGDVESLGKFLRKSLPDEEPPIQAALVFTGREVQLNAEESSIPALPGKKLKSFIQKQAKTNKLPQELKNQVQDLFDE